MAGETPGADWAALKKAANGVLKPAVYKKIFELAREVGGGTMVEIGTAHGAATIALALGARECGKPFHIYTADPFSGKFSSRSRFGDVAANLRIVQSHFAAFGVAPFITTVTGGCEDMLSQHPISDITLLVLDADGRIDRDLALLCDRLADRCTIVIDDVDDGVYVKHSNGMLVVDQKHRLGHLLTQRLVAEGMLVQTGQVHATGVYGRGPARMDRERILLSALPAYRELVFCDITGVPQPASEP
jgi:predicted O-methyltransferase YrrM